MKRIPHWLMFAALLSIGNAQTVPTAFAYQGRLTDASSLPLPDGTGYEVEVRLWSAPTGGTLLWGTRYTGIPLKSGALNLILGSGGTSIAGASTTDLKAAFNETNVYLGLTPTKNAAGVAIASPSEILPRQQILSSPFSFRAEAASSVLTDGVLSAAIKDGEVKTSDLAEGAVTSQAIADASIAGNDLAAGAALANLAVGSVPPDRMAANYAILEDRRANGTSPGASVPTTAWYTRSLGSTPVSLAGTSIALSAGNNSFTLQPGTYFIEAECPTLQAIQHQAAIFDSTNLTTAVVLGASSQGRIDGASGPHFATSMLRGYLTVTGSATSYVLRQYLTAGAELGRAASTGQQEVYSRIHIVRVK